MDFQKIWQKILAGLRFFWHWIKPYLGRLHRFRKRIWKKYHVTKVLILCALIIMLVTSIYLFFLAKSVKVSTLESSLKQSTVVYDEKGAKAGTLYGQKGTYVELDQISTQIQDAVISTEDRTFYTNWGFDLKGIARSAIGIVTAGHITGGGSTITQQLAKNAYLSLDQTLERKAKEIFMSREIEKHYTKKEILTMYLNNAYFGNGVWGVQDASEKYFGVSAKEVTLSEAATLAGMLKGPSIYNPIDNIENAVDRRNTVLGVMVDNGKITADQQKQEEQVDLASLVQDNYSSSDAGYQYPYYFDAVIDEAVSDYGLDEKDLLNKGYKIYTELDQDWQQQMDAVYANDSYFTEVAADGVAPQSASIAVDPNDGGIKALVGKRGEHVFRGFNYATQMQRSPGSSIKPLSVYAPALEAGYTPASVLEDSPQSYYPAENYSRTYSGSVPMYQALANSLNLPAVYLLNKIGIDAGYKKAKEFGLPLKAADKYYGLALGGLSKGVSPEDMAQAYSAFANAGKEYESHLITKIVDSTGAVIVDNTKAKYTQVVSKEVANQMTSMLLGTYSHGSAVSAAPTGYTVAGKTGTTETSFDASKTNDQWIIGYTPNIVITTWLGYEQTSTEHYLTGTSASQAGQIFKAEAEAILPYVDEASFAVKDAYDTDGEVVATATNSSSSGSGSDWQDSVKKAGDSAKEGLSKAAEAAKKGAEIIGDKLKGLLGGNE